MGLLVNTLRRFGVNVENESEVFIVFLCVAAIPFLFYTLLSETFMDGQTIGKKMMKIKVVKIDGFQAGFSDYIIRWIFTLIDYFTGFFVGTISMFLTKHTQRTGDLAAGTAVISYKSGIDISHTILMDVEADYKPRFSKNQVILFSDNDIRIIKESAVLSVNTADFTIMIRLSEKIESVMKISNPFGSNRELVDVLLKDYSYHTGK
jgi:hypothetical protein